MSAQLAHQTALLPTAAQRLHTADALSALNGRCAGAPVRVLCEIQILPPHMVAVRHRMH